MPPWARIDLENHNRGPRLPLTQFTLLRLTGVARTIRAVLSDISELMRQGLEDKFGTNFVDAGTSDQIWLDAGSNEIFQQNRDECTPRWPEFDLPSYYMTNNCGALVRRMYEKVMLLDTRYNYLQYQAFSGRQAAAEAAKEPIKIEF